MKKPQPKTILFSAFFAIIAIYAAFQVRDIVRGPQIVVESPADGDTFQRDAVEIKGQAERISRIFLNGSQIFTDQDGFFTQRLLLAQGYNIINLEAQDKFGRKVKKVIQVVFN